MWLTCFVYVGCACRKRPAADSPAPTVDAKVNKVTETPPPNTSKDTPKVANNGWGQFKDRQTFLDMHIC